jgi:predicted enzyme related to lactoylglutathione lyase
VHDAVRHVAFGGDAAGSEIATSGPAWRCHRKPMKHNIVWYDIPAIDLDRAVQFYSAVLGMPVTKDTAIEPPLAWMPSADGERMGCICVVPGFKPSADGVMIYLDVNGRLKEAVAAVRANGGTVQTDVHSIGPYGFRAEVLDSEGNCIALHAETEA